MTLFTYKYYLFSPSIPHFLSFTSSFPALSTLSIFFSGPSDLFTPLFSISSSFFHLPMFLPLFSFFNFLFSPGVFTPFFLTYFLTFPLFLSFFSPYCFHFFLSFSTSFSIPSLHFSSFTFFCSLLLPLLSSFIPPLLLLCPYLFSPFCFFFCFFTHSFLFSSLFLSLLPILVK